MSKIKCLILGILCFLMVGCGAAVLVGAGAATGVAGYKYYEGALIVHFRAPFKDTWDASLRALKGMEGLEVKSADHDVTEGKIWGTFSDKKPLEISVRYVSANESKVKIRVGVLGDQDASIVVKDRIKKELFGG